MEIIDEKASVKKKEPIGGDPPQEKIDQWKAQYGEIHSLTTEIDGQELVLYVRKPERTHLGRFAKAAMQDTLKALHALVQDTLLHPAPEVVNKLLSEKPGLVIPIGGELQTIAGTNQNFTATRL